MGGAKTDQSEQAGRVFFFLFFFFRRRILKRQKLKFRYRVNSVATKIDCMRKIMFCEHFVQTPKINTQQSEHGTFNRSVKLLFKLKKKKRKKEITTVK